MCKVLNKISKKQQFWKNKFFWQLKQINYVILRPKFFDNDLFFVLFHIISAVDIAIGVALCHLPAALFGFGIYNKV